MVKGMRWGDVWGHIGGKTEMKVYGQGKKKNKEKQLHICGK